jgi:hypothetical protein
VVLETSNETPQKSVARLRRMLRNVDTDS